MNIMKITIIVLNYNSYDDCLPLINLSFSNFCIENS